MELLSSPQEIALALPPFLELPPPGSSPGKATRPFAPAPSPRHCSDPQAAADWACSWGRGSRLGADSAGSRAST